MWWLMIHCDGKAKNIIVGRACHRTSPTLLLSMDCETPIQKLHVVWKGSNLVLHLKKCTVEALAPLSKTLLVVIQFSWETYISQRTVLELVSCIQGSSEVSASSKMNEISTFSNLYLKVSQSKAQEHEAHLQYADLADAAYSLDTMILKRQC
jgi:hypothetical protein